jgi:hypothetical protein
LCSSTKELLFIVLLNQGAPLHCAPLTKELLFLVLLTKELFFTVLLTKELLFIVLLSPRSSSSLCPSHQGDPLH